MATTPQGDTELQIYDPEFLKFVASPPRALAANLPPGWRKVAGEWPWLSTTAVGSPRATAPRATVQQRLSSLFTRLSVVRGRSPVKPEPRTYEVTLDLSKQVLRLEIPEIETSYQYWRMDTPKSWADLKRGFEAPLSSTLAEANVDLSKFTPVAALALKAKQFDDGLYACVETAADAGVGRFPARTDFLLGLIEAITTGGNPTASSIVAAAACLRGLPLRVSAEVARQAESLRQEFMADELRSKVLGLYTWSEELSRIFRRDRMLQTEITESTALTFATALSLNDGLRSAYDAHLRLAEKLTNPLVCDDLRQLAAALKEGRAPAVPARVSLFPPSRTHETDLVTKLYGDRPIPEGFDLANELIKRLLAKQLELTPKPNSGWYDHQTHALEALVVPERMPEGKHLSFSDPYRNELVGLFKALLAQTRETHIKQVKMPMIGAAGRERERVELYISPGLTLEPLPTYYLRRACSYRFIRRVLEQTFGPEGLEHMQRLTADGPVNLSLGEELRLVQSIFHGAYLQACAETGMAAQEGSDLPKPEDGDGDRVIFAAWQGSVQKDPDLGKDVRTMVPIFYDVVRKKTKVWMVLGMATKPLKVSYAARPAIKEIKDSEGGFMKPTVVFNNESHDIAYFATAEVYVTRVLDRTEFRKHCDHHKTYQAIISNLE